MNQNIVAIERDGWNVRVLTILCEVPNRDFDLIAAAKKAAADFCLTENGRTVYEYNCRNFNWGDFVVEVPNEFCEKYGFKKVDSCIGDIVVDWDESLVDDDEIE